MSRKRSRSGSLNLLCAAAALTALALLAPGAAPAAVKAVRPDRLRKVSDDTRVARTAAFATSLIDGAAFFEAPLALPAGSVIRKMVFYHRGGYGSPRTMVGISRIRLGQGAEGICDAESTDGSMEIIPVTRLLESPHTVEAGYRYVVYVTLANYSSMFYGAKVYFTPPGP